MKPTCDPKNVGGFTSQCKTDNVTEPNSLRNLSKVTTGSEAGIWAPRCWGVIGRQPAITWWIRRRCNSSWPFTSSLEYSETLCWIGLWCPCGRRISSVMKPWWQSCEDHDKIVAFIPWMGYDIVSNDSVRELRFQGMVKKVSKPFQSCRIWHRLIGVQNRTILKLWNHKVQVTASLGRERIIPTNDEPAKPCSCANW